MVRELSQHLAQNSSEWGMPTTGAWNFWLYNNAQPQRANLDVMWFHDKDEFPRVITRLDRREKSLAREFDNLREAHSLAPAYVPRPLQFGRWDGFWALWMEGVPGLPFQGEYSPRDLTAIVDMLVSIHANARVRDGGSRTERHRRMVLQPLEAAARFGDSAGVRAGCARLSEKIDAAWLASMPAIPQHGDFYAGNIISSGTRLHVLDWETFGDIDVPFCDLFTFLISLLTRDGAAPSQWNRALVHQAPALVERYAAGLGLAIPDLELLLPLALANWFHVMWLDGREKFATRMHQLIEHVMENPDVWRAVFRPARA